MKKILPALLAGVVLGGAGVWLVQRNRPAVVVPPAPTGKADAADAAGPHEGVRLTGEQIASAGIKTGAPKWETVPSVVNAYGRVLDPAPLVAAAAEVATTEVAAAASAKELARVEALHNEGNNASVQAVEAAQAAAERDRVQAVAARTRFSAAWGPALATELSQRGLEHLVPAGSSLVRVDVPVGANAPAETLTDLQLSLPGEPAQRFMGRVLGPATAVDSQFQGTSFLVLVPEHVLAAGLALRAELPGRGETTHCAVVPETALVRHEGSTFVFVPSGDRTFVRRRVEPLRVVGDGVALSSGVGEHDVVVLVGAQQLLSTELGSAGGED